MTARCLARWLSMSVMFAASMLAWPRCAIAQSEPVDAESTGEAATDATSIAEPSEDPVERSDAESARAADPTEADALRVAVLLLPAGDVDPATTDALTELLIAAVAGRDAPQIVGKEEIQALLGRDDEGMLACIASVTCLSFAGVELGVREIVSGTLARRDGSWIFVLERIDVRSGDVAGRVFRVVDGELSALIDALSDAVPELYVESVRPGRIVLHTNVGDGVVMLDGVTLGTTEEDVAFRRDLVPPGEHELIVSASGYEPWVRTVDVEEGASLILDAVLTVAEEHFDVPALTWAFGTAALLSLGGGIALGVSSSGLPGDAATMRETFEFFDAREREAVAADVLFAASGAFLIAAAVPLVVALVEDEPSTALVIAPLPLGGPRGIEGGGLVVGGHF